MCTDRSPTVRASVASHQMSEAVVGGGGSSSEQVWIGYRIYHQMSLTGDLKPNGRQAPVITLPSHNFVDGW